MAYIARLTAGAEAGGYGSSQSAKEHAKRLGTNQLKAMPDWTERFGATAKTAVQPTTPGGIAAASPHSQLTAGYSPNAPVASAPPVPVSPDVGVEGWIDELKKNLNTKTSSPKLPAQIQLDQYRTEVATINDIAKKYGFDYSRAYAEKQAEVLAQAQRDQLQASRERMQKETDSAKTDLEHDFFQKYLQQQQGMADIGLNAGIASERNLRLDMSRQNVLGDILANAQLRNQELDRDDSRITKEQHAYAEQLYNERLQQGFGNAMDVSRFNQSENHFQANLAQQQRQSQVDEAWRAHEWNNMSYADKMKMQADVEKYGMDMAWDRHKFDAGMAFEAGQAGGAMNIAPQSFQTTKGTAPAAFQNHLAAAAQYAGIPQDWVQPIAQLVANESTWKPTAKNPKSTAHGYAQFLKGTREQYEKKTGLSYDDPTSQLIMMIEYIKDRYGTAHKALEFWNKNKWY